MRSVATGTTTSGHNKEVAALTTAQLKTATVFVNITVHLPHEWNFHSPQAIKKVVLDNEWGQWTFSTLQTLQFI